MFVVSDDMPRFRTRGTIHLKAGRENGVALSQMELSEKDRSLLKVRETGLKHYISTLKNHFNRTMKKNNPK